MAIDEKLYRQEIEELTYLVKNEWDDLRRILIDSNFDINKTLLVSFAENEDESEYGVLVNENKQVFEYKRSTAMDKNNIENFSVIEITNDPNACNKSPQIEVAKKMIDEGCLWG